MCSVHFLFEAACVTFHTCRDKIQQVTKSYMLMCSTNISVLNSYYRLMTVRNQNQIPIVHFIDEFSMS